MTDIFPSKIRLVTGTIAAFNDAGGVAATDTTLSSAVLPPMALGGSYYASGLLAVMSLRVVNATTTNFLVKLYDLDTGDEVTDGVLTVELMGVTVPSTGQHLYAGLSMIQRGRSGLAYWYPLDNAVIESILRIYLSKYVTTTGGNRRLVTDEATLQLTGPVCDVSPFSKTSDLYLLIGRGNTESGTEQVMCYKATITDTGWPEYPTHSILITMEKCWGSDINPSFFANRPNTCLKVQNTPTVAGLDSQLVLLMGNWVAPTKHLVVDDPRIVLMTINGLGTYSHEFGYGRAHGMIVNQYGDIFITGTRDIVNDGAFLICRYGVHNFGETQARVEHGQDDLGDYAGDPDDTHVVTPMWNGSRLIVQDIGIASSKIYVYDRDLTFINSFTAGTEFRGSNKATSWWGESY